MGRRWQVYVSGYFNPYRALHNSNKPVPVDRRNYTFFAKF